MSDDITVQFGLPPRYANLPGWRCVARKIAIACEDDPTKVESFRLHWELLDRDTILLYINSLFRFPCLGELHLYALQGELTFRAEFYVLETRTLDGVKQHLNEIHELAKRYSRSYPTARLRLDCGIKYDQNARRILRLTKPPEK